MEKAFQMGKTSTTGSFHLFIGVAISTIIMAVGTIILGNILGEDGYGLYSIILVPATFMTLFRDWGVNSAITKYVASLKSEGREEEIRDTLIAGYLFEILIGSVLLVMAFFSAEFIATAIYHRTESAILIAVISFSIFGGSLLTPSQSIFIGFEKMGLNSFILICQAIVKTAIGPVLVILGYGVFGAAVGYTASFILGVLIGVATLYVSILRKLQKTEKKNHQIFATMKSMLRYGIPLGVSSILGGILTQYYGLTLASFVPDDAILGNYYTAVNFAVLLTFVTVPIATVLFPAFSKLDPKNEHKLTSRVFASSVKYTALLLVPATMVIMVLSTPMIGTLYLGKYPAAPLFLSILVMVNLLSIFGSLSLGSFLAGLGETKVAMILSIVTILIGFPLGFLLIPVYGVLGVIIASIVSGTPSTFLGLVWVWRRYNAKADSKSSARILISSSVAAAATYGVVSYIIISDWAKLVIGATLFLAVYIFFASLIGAVTKTEIDNLRLMSADLGMVSKIVNIPLKAAEKTLQLKSRNKTDPEHY